MNEMKMNDYEMSVKLSNRAKIPHWSRLFNFSKVVSELASNVVSHSIRRTSSSSKHR